MPYGSQGCVVVPALHWNYQGYHSILNDFLGELRILHDNTEIENGDYKEIIVLGCPEV